MFYERGKWFAALLSGTSVIVAFGAMLDVWSSISPIVNAQVLAAVLAAAGATISIVLSRRLSKQRERARVFLIYAREDLEVARHLADRLATEGFSTWLDVDELKPGVEWKREIKKALETSAAAVVIISKHLSKRGYVQSEVRQALELLQSAVPEWSPVLPVRIDDSEAPEVLRRLQWVDLRDEANFEILRDALRQLVRVRTAT